MNKKDDISSMLSGAGVTEGTQQKRPKRENSISTTGRSSTRTTPTYTKQRRIFDAPVTKQSMELLLMRLDPDDTFASDSNPRVQSLLSMNDPEVRSIRTSIKENTQQDPVFARPVLINDETKYEVFVGTTRRFISIDLKKELGKFDLLAWVGDFTYEDMWNMARVENRDRRDTSFYEEGIDAINLTKRFPEKSHSDLALMKGVSDSKFSSLTSLIERFPDELMFCLESPSLLTRNSTRDIIKDLEKASDKKMVIEHVVERSKSKKFESIKSLHKTVKEFSIVSMLSAKTNTRKPIAINDRVSLRFKRDDPSQIKIEAKGVTEEERKALVEFLGQAFK